jgi:GT2 family glycosyltransferase
LAISTSYDMDHQDTTIPHQSKSETPVHATAASSAPLLSVIVPCYNSSRELEQCLDALEQSTFNDFDVLVVDDGSVERIEPIVLKRGFRYLRIDGPGGPARARNHGARHVTGTYVAFIDADVCVHRNCLAKFADALRQDPDAVAVIGTYDQTPADPGFISQYKNLFHRFVHKSCHGPVSTFWTGCGAIRRDVFAEFGGFDEVLYRRPAIEDIELGTWITAAGHRILLDAGVQCTHLKRWTLSNLISTDLWCRGVPWTRLMLRARRLESGLNVSREQRASVALAGATGLAAVAAFWVPWLWLAVAALVLAVTFLNRRFYQFFVSERGIVFAVRTVPLHWLYFIICGLSVVLGTLGHYLSPAATTPRPATAPARSA